MQVPQSSLHSFLFDGLPVRGVLVCLTDAWTELLQRRAAAGPAYPEPVCQLLGQMAAAAVMLQASIRFNGALVLQIQGDGPVRMAVAEVQPDLALRATATLTEPVQAAQTLPDLINRQGNGRCALTLDPAGRSPGQQPYQGVVSLSGEYGERLEHLSTMLEQYMQRSEQLPTRLVLAAHGERAAGLLIQRLPLQGQANLGAQIDPAEQALAQEQADEDFSRIACLASSLTPEELLTLDADQLLHRLFWQEPLARFAPQRPRFQCRCSRERVAAMLHGLGPVELGEILADTGFANIGCDFCGTQYRFEVNELAALASTPT